MRSTPDGFLGPLLVERTQHHFQVDDCGADPEEVLKLFFEKIHDEVCLQRP